LPFDDDKICQKCHGAGHVYYLHARHPGIEITGGKRIVCPECAGTGRANPNTLQGTLDFVR
jgi:DnaJ-class molecular chaperone